MQALKLNLMSVRGVGLAGFSLVASLDLVATWLLTPLLRLVTTFLLAQAAIPFVSVDNVVTLLTTHPLIVCALLVEVCVVLALLGLQVLVAFSGLRLLVAGRFSFAGWLAACRQQVVNLGWRGALAWVPLLIVAMPIATLLFRTPLLVNIKADAFILDYLTRRPSLMIGGVLVYAACLFIVVRWLSWGRVKRALGLALWWGAWSWLVNGLVVLVNHGNAPTWLALSGLLIAQVAAELALSATALGLVATPPKASGYHQWRPWWLLILVVFVFAAMPSDWTYLTTKLAAPLTVAHRGVDGQNGVPNSIAVLKKTHRAAHPDFVEMDVHETADHQFVVVHDENLKQLTGVDKAPHQLTLKQLTKLVAKQDGYRAKLVSFDDYLAAAEQNHQRLIVELKATPHDSKGLLARFNQRYGARLIKDGDMVHSLDYAYVAKLHRLNPKLTVLYCMAYNFTNPAREADGVTAEYSTLNHRFIDAAHQGNQLVMAWTVNNAGAMKQALFDHADGVITDRVSTLNKVIKEVRTNDTLESRLVNYFNPLPNLE
ncbi:glycerophosphodiester phosphodiesterase [Limosilactobacillus fermentum]